MFFLLAKTKSFSVSSIVGCIILPLIISFSYAEIFVKRHDSNDVVRFSFGPASGGADNINKSVIDGESQPSKTFWPNKKNIPGIRITCTIEQDLLALETIDEIYKEKPHYSVFTNNCAHVSRLILIKAGINVPKRYFDCPGMVKSDVNKFLQQNHE